jgi:hypothetical protein
LVTRVTHSENRKSHSVGMAMRCRIDLIKSNPLQKECRDLSRSAAEYGESRMNSMKRMV